MENNKKTNWSISIGLYPGVLMGIRSYIEDNRTTHVFYLPLIDIAFVNER